MIMYKNLVILLSFLLLVPVLADENPVTVHYDQLHDTDESNDNPLNDWPRWRGPDANSMVPDPGLNPKALNREAKVLWQADIGKGFSSPSIKGDFLYLMGNSKHTASQGTILDTAGTCRKIAFYPEPCREIILY